MMARAQLGCEKKQSPKMKMGICLMDKTTPTRKSGNTSRTGKDASIPRTPSFSLPQSFSLEEMYKVRSGRGHPINEIKMVGLFI